MCPDMNTPAVDVRDVAFMHVAAIDSTDVIGERVVANAGPITFIDVARTLRDAHPERKIPVRAAPDWLVKAVGRFDPFMKVIAKNLGRNGDVDGTAAEKLFDFTYIPTEDALLASSEYILAKGT